MPTTETVTHSAPEITSEDISDPPENEPPQTEPGQDLQSPQEHNIERPSPENDPTEEHMEDEDAQQGSSK